MKPRLGALSEDEQDKEALLPESERLSPPKRRPPLTQWLWILSTLFGAVVFLLVGVILGRAWPGDTDASCTLHVSQDSPLLEDIDIHYKTTQFNGSFMHENEFRQPAGPEVDAAWESLGVNCEPALTDLKPLTYKIVSADRSVAIPEERAKQAGIRHDQVKINSKYGGGFPANVEGLHQLHCLNLLRQALWYNFDYYHALGHGAFKNEDDILQKHVSHCLDIVRQQLMCTVDIGVLGQVWWNPASPAAFVDFNTHHKCRNFEAVRQWAEVRQLPEHPPKDFLHPPEAGDMIWPEIP